MQQISKRILLILCSVFCFGFLFAQENKAVSFIYSKERTDANQVLLTIKAFVKPGIKLYSLKQPGPDGINSDVVFDSSSSRYLSGAIMELTTPVSEKDSNINATVNFFTDSAVWQQKANIKESDSLVLKAVVNYMYKSGEEYLAGETKIKFFIKPDKDIRTNQENTNGVVPDGSLFWIFLAAFGGGLLALLTPCVYSMIPVTVSYFTKRSNTKAEGVRNALYYAGSIVVIFTLLGFIVTLIFGPAALNNLATNWIANLVFFALFLIFGFSFLGAFEISLPSSWTNKSDSKANSGNFLGIFFMALTLVLVSFSCTGPIIGNLLVLASRGNYFGPLVGMLGFSCALALPFAMFAFFPSKINVLGKAGGWLNAVKVTLGFVELALALKFLSNADLVKGWRILDREIFIVLWVVIFILLGIYLLGKLKFKHDDELPRNDFGLPYLTVTRLMFALSAFAFALYMIPGLFGAPLKSISAFLPPMGTQNFVLGSDLSGSNAAPISSNNELPHPTKYYEQMKIYEPEVVTKYGMTTYFDYDEALAVARKTKRTLMLDFTGINCVNCRKMEGQVWSDPEIMKRLKEDFVIVSLYVDVHNVDLPEELQYFSSALNKKVETLGDKNADFQVTQYGANSQPYYFFLDGNGNKLYDQGYGYDPDIEKFKKLLDSVKQK